MVPDNILKEHIEKAIQEIDTNGIEKGAHSSTYDVLYNGKRYPPKLVISLANKYANGAILPRDTFSGGPSHPAFKLLDKLGFSIVQKSEQESLINVKQEFADWLVSNSPESYKKMFLGYTEESILEKLTEIDTFFEDFNLFEFNKENLESHIRDIKHKISRKERANNSEFEKFDAEKGSGIPKAVIGKKNYIKFLEEYFKDVSYWIFQGNPRIYNITNALQSDHLKTWKVAAHKDKMKPGDKVIIWQTGEQSGCYALAEVISEVGVFEEEAFELQHYVEPTDKENASDTNRVKLKITTYLADNPILWSAIKNNPKFANFKAGNQGTNFSATPLEYNTLKNMVESIRFSWVKTHKEIVQYLMDKENNQKELIDLLKSVGVGPFNNDVDQNGNKVDLTEIDPFTFFFFIYKYGPVNRLDYLQKIAEKLKITVPSDESGIPSAQGVKLWLFPHLRYRNNNEIQRLWDFFKSACEDRITDEMFENVLTIASTGSTKLTEGLFEVNPERYFPINGPTKPYLKEVLNIDPNFNTYSDYEDILKQIRSKTNTPFYQLSYEAWLWNDSNASDVGAFRTSIENYSTEELLFYFNYLDEIVNYLGLTQGDKRVVYSCKNKYLNFNIGQRICWRIDPRKGKKYHIITDKIIDETSGKFDGEPENFYHVFNNENQLNSIKQSSLNAGKVELERTTKSGYKRHNNAAFEKAVFDKSFRAQFIKSYKMDKSSKVLNQLFYGPPGTGKTYGTIAEAIKIVDNEYFKANKTNREALTKRYQELLITDWKEANGQIAFCTFHQSFTYEDFVEGIKPKTTQNKDVYYDIESGIFKRICDLADSSKSTIKVKNEGAINWSDNDFRKAFFYKLSLGEANNPEDREIYEFCRDNDYISIGFAGAHNLSGKSETEIKQLCEDNNEQSSAGSQLSTFIHAVSIGDYVLISKGNLFVRALAKVVGNYEYHDDFPIGYNHFRKVEWVFTDENIPIEEIYHTTLMQRSIYRIDHDKLKKDFFVKDNINEIIPNETIKPYVIVIDEINRGNVASIFGELITLIELDKRTGADEELQVILPYSKEKFSVPDNVFIIGTMNTADRSIEALDSALRRRFSFTEVKPKPTIIDEVLKDKATWNSVSLSLILETINKRITVLIDRDHQIGHSYFLKLKEVQEPNFGNALKAVFAKNIIPLLQEYFFNDYVKIGMILGSGFIKVSAANENLFAEIEDSLEDDYSDAKEYEFTYLEPLDDNQFKSILNTLLNK